MVEKITFDDIKTMVTECVKRLLESTNMRTLYHFTTISRFWEIAKTNKLISANYFKDYWDNNSHISVTRHKSNFEGYAAAHPKENCVRIQLNVPRLNSSHNIIRIKPMEFYSPQRHGRWDNYSSKEYYQKNNLENGIEYHNQAEEGVQMPDVSSQAINHLHKYVDRIDILFDKLETISTDYDKCIYELSQLKDINNTGFGKVVPIFVYGNKNHFALQDNVCMTLSKTIKYIEENVCDISKAYGDNLKKFLDSINSLEENLNESTNMKHLYHFTTFARFASIARNNFITSANYQKGYWDNSNHISLTRHKGNLEGFAEASYYKDSVIVRLEFDTEKLNSRHDVLNIKPMEYYSPKRERFDASYGRKINGNDSGKSRYQDKDYYYQKLKSKENGTNLKWHPLNRHEYQNQAEEGLQVPSNTIENINKCISRVDIYHPNLQALFCGFKQFKNEIKSFAYILETEFAKTVPIFVYEDERHFILQDNCNISLKDLVTDLTAQPDLYESVDELNKQTLQNAARAAYDKGRYGEPDDRVKKFRQAAVDKHREEDQSFRYSNRTESEDTQAKYITDNKGNKLVIFDSDYNSLQDLYNGVKQGRLLIHCREVDENNIPQVLSPEFGPTVQDAYGCEFSEDMDLPELIFASENFNWAKNYPKNHSSYTERRNGVFFVYGDTFEKSIGDGYVQTIDGQIYMNYDVPVTVETDDWFSEEDVDVAGVMVINQ